MMLISIISHRHKIDHSNNAIPAFQLEQIQGHEQVVQLYLVACQFSQLVVLDTVSFSGEV
jgi:hypothetical protein